MGEVGHVLKVIESDVLIPMNCSLDFHNCLLKKESDLLRPKKGLKWPFIGFIGGMLLLPRNPQATRLSLSLGLGWKAHAHIAWSHGCVEMCGCWTCDLSQNSVFPWEAAGYQLKKKSSTKVGFEYWSTRDPNLKNNYYKPMKVLLSYNLGKIWVWQQQTLLSWLL